MPNHDIDGVPDATPSAEKGTAADRLIAVGCVLESFLPCYVA